MSELSHALLALVLATAAQQRADTLFTEAKELMSQARFLEACPKLAQAQALEPHAGGTALALALCHEGEQKLATALRELHAARKMAIQANNKEREQLASEHIANLTAHVSKLILVPRPEGVSLTLDGAPIPTDTHELEVDGGDHVVRAARVGFKPWELRLSVATKDDRVRVEVPPLEQQPRRSVTPLRISSFAVGAAGVAGIAVGSYFGVRALASKDASRRECLGLDCNQKGFDLNEDAKRSARAADIGVGVGVAAVVTAVVLFVVDARSEPALTVAPVISRELNGFLVQARF